MRATKRISATLLAGMFAFTAIAQRRREVTPEERQKIEAAMPAKAAVKPRKPRKLLIVEGLAKFAFPRFGGPGHFASPRKHGNGISAGRRFLRKLANIASTSVDYRASHPSVPDADLAVELMGTKTSAYEAVISHDTSLLAAGQVQQFDAVHLNTVGDIFGTPELREGFAAYMHNGGGLVANHGTSAASPDWPEFGEILGATGAARRSQDEKIFVRVDDRSHPLNAALGGKGFEFTGEVFRFNRPRRGPRSTFYSALICRRPI